MSIPEDDPFVADHRQAFQRLDEVVAAAEDRIHELQQGLETADAQGREMEELLRKFTGGEEDPSRLLARLNRLERENRDLSERLTRGREGVERLLARIRFLEEQS